MKDHEIAFLVNHLRDIAKQYGATQQLRERIKRRLVPEIRRVQAELKNWHVAEMLKLEEQTNKLQEENIRLRNQIALLEKRKVPK